MEFILPNIGEGIDTVSVTEILIKEGQKVEMETSILLVETDKASMEIPIDCACTITKIMIEVGDLISPGQIILEIDKSVTTDSPSKEDKTENNKKFCNVSQWTNIFSQ